MCPECGSLICYDVSRGSRPRFRCRDCRKDFTPTNGTLFASHKLPISVYLAAIVLARERRRRGTTRCSAPPGTT